jgi:hypothetical protein
VAAAKLEPFVQLTIVILTVWALCHMAWLHNPIILWKQGFGADFLGYLELAKGQAPDHTYKQWIGYGFVPFLWISNKYGEMQAVFLWMGLLTASYMVLAHYLCKVEYGWFLALAFLKIFWFSLSSGNITPILCVALLFLESAWLAVLVKPHFALIGFGVAFFERHRLHDK